MTLNAPVTHTEFPAGNFIATTLDLVLRSAALQIFDACLKVTGWGERFCHRESRSAETAEQNEGRLQHDRELEGDESCGDSGAAEARLQYDQFKL